jgi:hypothetical protein
VVAPGAPPAPVGALLVLAGATPGLSMKHAPTETMAAAADAAIQVRKARVQGTISSGR